MAQMGSNLFLFVLWMLIIGRTLALSSSQQLKERYFGKFDEDTMIYHVISIPYNAYDLKIRVWIDKIPKHSEFSASAAPKLLLKYDGLPTLASHDGSFAIPLHPNSLLISDSSPDMAQLYVGVWGGKLLHSNRYFAGSPSNIDFGIEVVATICEGVFNENECHPHVFLPLTVLTASVSDLVSIQDGESGLVGSRLIENQSGSQRIFSQGVFVTVGRPFVFSLNIPPALELVIVTMTIRTTEMQTLCSVDSLNATRRLFMHVYRDEDDNEYDNGSEYLDINCLTSCRRIISADETSGTGSQLVCQPADLQLAIEFPLNGFWNLYVDLSFKPTSDNGIGTIKKPSTVSNSDKFHAQIVQSAGLTSFERNTSKMAKQRLVGGEILTLEVEVTAFSCPTGKTGYSNVFLHSFKSPDSSSTETQPVNCLYTIGDLTKLQSADSTSSGFVVYSSSRDEVIQWNSGTLSPVPAFVDYRNLTTLPISRLPFAMFSIAAEPTVGNFPVGGYMKVIMRVKRPVSSADTSGESIREEELEDGASAFGNFAVAVRCGGFASDPFKMKWGIGNKMGDLHLGNDQSKSVDGSIGAAGRFSSNGMMLLTTEAEIVQDKIQSFSSDVGAEDVWWNPFEDKHSSWFNVVATWFSNLGKNTSATAAAASKENVELFHVMQYSWLISKPTLSDLNTGQMSIRVVPMAQFPSNEKDLISLSVAFMSCSKSSCAHGVCTLQKGSVMASSCECRYPWAGERCSDLSIPLWAYVCEVMLLVISNLSMIPSLLFCYRVECWILLVVLASSMSSSMLYHICDTDVWCGGVSFSTWQVVDNLFCILSITSLILYYAPVSSTAFATIIFIFMSLLVSPVSSSPTSPANGIGGALLAVAVVALQWMRYYYGGTSQAQHVLECAKSLSSSSSGVSRGFDANEGEYSLVRPSDEEEDANNAGESESSELVPAGSSSPTTLSHGEARGSGDIEMFSVNSNSAATSFARRRQDNSGSSLQQSNDEMKQQLQQQQQQQHLDATMTAMQMETQSTGVPSLVSVDRLLVTCMRCKHTRQLYGTLLVVVGILSFANQDKDNYWLLHSLWHICMMLGGYLLLLSRNKFVSRMLQK